MNIIPTVKFMHQTLKHKLYVFQAGIKTKAPLLRLLVHDWTKFMPSEAPHFARQMYGSADDPAGFSQAWNHHTNHNKHHWEYWIVPTSGKGGLKGGTPLPMPEKYVREMAANWLATTKSSEGQFPSTFREWGWWRANFKQKIVLHKDTRELMLKIMTEALRKKNE